MSVLIQRFRYILTSIIGLLMLGYAYYTHHVSEDVRMWSYDFWFISVSGVIGFILLVTGSKYINRLIETLIEYLKSKIKKSGGVG